MTVLRHECTDAKFATLRCTYSNCPTSYQHWQLRDLVHCCEEEPDTVYCVWHAELLRFNVRTEEASIVRELPFEPTSMAVAHGFVAAGGDRSQLFVARLSDGQPISDSCIGGTVNNALHINGPNQGDMRLYVCNNDKTIKIFQLRTSCILPSASIRCPVAMNYAALSPDATRLVAVGDSQDAYLFQERPDGSYQRLASFRETREPSMSCAWNAAGTCFAVAGQEGKAVVWDQRSGKVVARFRTAEACRNVKFAAAPVDLLAFSEQEGQVHLVDSRNYGSKQVLAVGASNISGIAFTPEGNELYVGHLSGLTCYSINTQARRAFPFCDTI